VTTATTSWALSSSASSDGTAGDGVPAKTSLSVRARTAGAG